MAAIFLAAPVAPLGFFQRQAREDGDAVIALHAAQMDMGIAQGLQRREGKIIGLGLDLLQADDVGRMFACQPRQDVEAQAHGIDVPGYETQEAIPGALVWGSGYRRRNRNPKK